MVEERRENNPVSEEVIAQAPEYLHYSEKGGHRFRGMYNRIQLEFERQFGCYSRGLVPEIAPSTIDRDRRRHMRRIPTSGRSRR